MIGFLALVGVAACDSSPDFGPLAVLHTTGGLQARGGTGPVHIGNDCVTVTVENGDDLLLIWHQHEEGWEVGWNEDEREIAFSAPGEPPVTIRDGDIITVGGASLVGDVPVERERDWLATPHESCTSKQWVVSSVTKEP